MTFRRERYPREWPAISAAVMARAGNRCECRGECGSPHDNGPSVGDSRDRKRCGAPHLEMIVRDPVRPWLWWPHLDHDEANNDASNLRALCQRCHLVMDGPDNRARRRERQAAERGQRPLPALAVMPEHRRPA